MHARWAMLGVAGVLGAEVFNPDVFWYEAGQPGNLPGPFKDVNMGGLLAFQFCMMHFVEVRRWQDYRVHGSVNEARCLGPALACRPCPARPCALPSQPPTAVAFLTSSQTSPNP